MVCTSRFNPSLIHGLCAILAFNSRFMRLFQAPLDTCLDSPLLCQPLSSRFARDSLLGFEKRSPEIREKKSQTITPRCPSWKLGCLWLAEVFRPPKTLLKILGDLGMQSPGSHTNHKIQDFQTEHVKVRRMPFWIPHKMASNSHLNRPIRPQSAFKCPETPVFRQYNWLL